MHAYYTDFHYTSYISDVLYIHFFRMTFTFIIFVVVSDTGNNLNEERSILTNIQVMESTKVGKALRQECL